MTDTIKKGDFVEIVDRRTPKFGRIGRVNIMASNGVIITFPDGSGTAVKFNHLKKIKHTGKLEGGVDLKI